MLQVTDAEIGGKKVVCISIEYAMKDSLKADVPSARWFGDSKCWYVSYEQKDDLLKWREKAKNVFSALLKVREEISKWKSLSGKTYPFKDLLKKEFGAVYHEGKWKVSPKVFKEAQEYLNGLNAEL